MFYFLLRLINKKKFLKLQFAFGKLDFYNSRVPPRETSRVCDISTEELNGRNIFTLTSKTRPSGKYVLYLHGGAYVQSFVRQHWKFLSMLVQRTNCTVVAPDYPLAPKHTFVDAYTMLIALYKRIIKQAGSQNMVLMGDSAGGGLALGLAQQMRIEGCEQPKEIVLLSPWLDLTLTNPDIPLIDPLDPFLDISSLRRAGEVYAGSADRHTPLLSPINGPVDGLGHLNIFVGSRDILVADARKLKRLAAENGIEINYREYKDMVHVWMLLNFYESKLAREEIISLVE